MKVSVVTVAYNSEQTIRQTIESVLGQDYSNLEYLVVDGASNDATVNIVKEYQDDIDVLVSEPDRGIYDAMNKGIRRASGDVIALLNSDDHYARPSVLSELLECMRVQGADTVFADLVYFDPENESRIVRYYDSSGFHPQRIRYGWMPAHPTLLVKKSLYDSVGLFDLSYSIAADFEFIVRLYATAQASYAYYPSAVVRMRPGGVSTSGLRSSWLLNKEIVRACRENGLDTSLVRVLSKIPRKLLERVRRPARP